MVDVLRLPIMYQLESAVASMLRHRRKSVRAIRGGRVLDLPLGLSSVPGEKFVSGTPRSSSEAYALGK